MKWLDLHNLLSAATLIWLTVIGVTGVFNELSTALFGLWQITDVKQLLASYGNQPIPLQPTSVETAFVTTQAAVKDKTIASIVYPTRQLGSPIHYVVWTKGNTPLTSQLFTPVLVDARIGALAAVLDLPRYLRALELSRPLHFGDYAGLPLKVIWAVLDGFALVVLGGGLYLWWVRRKQVAVRVEHLRHAGAEMSA